MREGIDDENDNEGEGDDKEKWTFEIWDVDVSTFGVCNGGGVVGDTEADGDVPTDDGDWKSGEHVLVNEGPGPVIVARDASGGNAAGRALCCFRKNRIFSSIEH